MATAAPPEPTVAEPPHGTTEPTLNPISETMDPPGDLSTTATPEPAPTALAPAEPAAIDAIVAGNDSRQLPLSKTPPPDTNRSILTYSGASPPDMAKELESLRKWVATKQQEEELARLQGIKRRFESGDLAAITEAWMKNDHPGLSPPVAIRNRSCLPKPEPPHPFRQETRQDFNRWTRDCEGFHISSPNDFTTESQKVTFGLQYVSETRKTVWDIFISQERHKNPFWEPTWFLLKQKMLDTLGTLAERQQKAYDAIKNCRQRHGQSPSELLLYLRTQWEEVGDTNPARHAHEYVCALAEPIRHDLWLIPLPERSTVSQLEELANMITRRQGRDTSTSDKPRDSRRTAGRTTSGYSDTSAPKRVRTGYNSNNDHNLHEIRNNGHDRRDSPRDRRDPSTMECWNCHKTGHKRHECPSPPAPDNRDGPGKGAGREA